MQGNLRVSDVTKYYKKFKAVDDANLLVNEGEFFTILGPSGSGKTTLLKLIAGFEEISAGSIKLKDSNIATKKPYERNIGMVFQNYALFPHMSVAENIAYPLKRRKLRKKDVKTKVMDVLQMVHLKKYADHFPNQLSGGQQQRVALARAIVFTPPLLLLDEPLGALDKNLRQRMQFEIKQIQESLQITTISVTHDQEEALIMSDRICIMNEGRIEQIDTPENIYRHPANRFVAEFIGEINLIKAEIVTKNDKRSKVRILDDDLVTIDSLDSSSERGELYVALRPENIQIVKENANFDNIIQGKILSKIYLGGATLTKLEMKTGQIIEAKVPSYSSDYLVIGEERMFGWNIDDATLLLDSEEKSEKSNSESEVRMKNDKFEGNLQKT